MKSTYSYLVISIYYTIFEREKYNLMVGVIHYVR